jgi:hypothetical protein
MAQIIGNGDPVNPALPSFFDATFDLSSFGLLDRFEFRADRITRSDVSGTQRISEVAPVGTARPFGQVNTANRPAYLAGGGPGGLTDAADFVGTRPDQFTLGDIPAQTQTKLLVIRASLPAADNTNMHLLSTLNSGNGRNAMYLRRVTGALTLQTFVGDAAPNNGLTFVSVPHDTWMAVAMTLHLPTRTVSAGVRAAGASNWTWSNTTWPEGFGPTVTNHTFGARPVVNTLDGFTGRIAGGAVFVGHDLRTSEAMQTNVNNWLFGPNSIFGL